MDGTVSATEARVHFGELMRHVVDKAEPVVVERGGHPQVVVLSVERYEELVQAQEDRDGWKDLVTRTQAQSKPDPADSAWPPLPSITPTPAAAHPMEPVDAQTAEERLKLIHEIVHTGQVAEPVGLYPEPGPEATRPLALPEPEGSPFQGEFVAIVDKWAVDHDADLYTLYLRVRRRYGEGTALIVPAQYAEPPICRLESLRGGLIDRA